MAGKGKRFTNLEPRFLGLVTLIVLAFALGGGSRSDILSTLVLRPVAIIAAAFGLWSMSRDDYQKHKALIWAFAAILISILVYLVPLPPELWRGLPGRDIVAEIDDVTGVGQIWRPLTLVPYATWNAFFSLFVPLAIFLNAICLNDQQLRRLLPVILCIGVVSSIIGIFQISGDPKGPLFFYRLTNNGTSVGLFANRNHHGAFLACLFPMLAVFAAGISEAQSSYKKWSALIFTFLLIPLLLATGSRAGGILGLLGLVSAIYLYRTFYFAPRARNGASTSPWIMRSIIGGALFLVGLVVVAAKNSRVETLSRLSKEDAIEDLRFHIWDQSMDLLWDYFPFGSGPGTFVEIYKAAETPATTFHNYVNHVHNDWLEIILTMGLLGLIGLVVLVVAFSAASFRLFGPARKNQNRVSNAFGQMAIIVMVLLMCASIVDYPLRTPALQSFVVIMVLWIWRAIYPAGSTESRTLDMKSFSGTYA